ncbi:hypothetical protein PEL8287_01657 [Roseovarius litorisediminis]|uniref:Uncharacterized protein n=1 Tax=Roseovarius litorisediminis TaxID=1312363 RepID=A0A1Y5S723_9RHOB|nr:hypothetical protein [Roseovarius litorisediminis]SLN33978.1 hypothetical protein PEL8287_01657 [Roseovarius litorisediminis]
MIRIIVAISLSFGLATAPVSVTASEAVSPERVEAFVAVVEANGCRMTQYRANTVLPEAGFDNKTETKSITELLIEQERARILDGQLVLFGGACGETLKYSGRERFFAGLADNGCKMNSEEARLILPRVGVEMQEVQLLMERMIHMSEVSLSDDEKTVYLEQGLCDKFRGLSASMAATKPIAQQRTAEELKAAFVEFMKSVDCKMTRAQSHEMLPAAGFTGKELRPIIAGMIKDGEATMTGEQDLLTLKKEVCNG